MTTLNAYATVAEYKSFVTARGQSAPAADTSDDATIESLLKAASRYADNSTGRRFYPSIQTRYFDVPGSDQADIRSLKMDTPLLEVISVVNGNGATIPSTEYVLNPRNDSPYLSIRLIGGSSYLWENNGSDNKQVIAVTGIWGFHNYYTNAWLLGSTLNEALDTSETGIDVTSGTPFAVGNLIKFGNELGYVSAVVTNTLTSTRGENGSTAAAHDTAGNVYIWQVMEELKTAVLETAMRAYKRRFGQSSGGAETITGAGIVLTPKDIPSMMIDFCETFRNYT